MIGKSWIRVQGLQDPLLVEELRLRGWDDVPLWKRKFPARDAAIAVFAGDLATTKIKCIAVAVS